jgi:hypothetical protein
MTISPSNLDLDDLDRPRRWNDAPVPPSGILHHHEPLFPLDAFRLLAGVELADRLGGMLESGVVLMLRSLADDLQLRLRGGRHVAILAAEGFPPRGG